MKHPAILRVRDTQRAEEIMALCAEHDIMYVIAVEPDKPEDITDIERALNRAEPVRAVLKPGRNDPCPCGSARKTKKCCPQLVA